MTTMRNTIYSILYIRETVIFRIDTYVRLNMIESTAYFSVCAAHRPGGIYTRTRPALSESPKVI